MNLFQSGKVKMIESVFRMLTGQFSKNETVIIDIAVEPAKRLFVPYQCEFLRINTVWSHDGRRDRIDFLLQFDFGGKNPSVHSGGNAVDFDRTTTFRNSANRTVSPVSSSFP